MPSDAVNHPTHYTSHPSGVEAVDITEHLSFSLGNCVKYLLRRKYKNREAEDLKKAIWYAKRELSRDGIDATRMQSPPAGLLTDVVRVASHDDSHDIGLAIGLLAVAAWSGDARGSIESAVSLVECELRRVERPFAGLRPASEESYA